MRERLQGSSRQDRVKILGDTEAYPPRELPSKPHIKRYGNKRIPLHDIPSFKSPLRGDNLGYRRAA